MGHVDPGNLNLDVRAKGYLLWLANGVQKACWLSGCLRRIQWSERGDLSVARSHCPKGRLKDPKASNASEDLLLDLAQGAFCSASLQRVVWRVPLTLCNNQGPVQNPKWHFVAIEPLGTQRKLQDRGFTPSGASRLRLLLGWTPQNGSD